MSAAAAAAFAAKGDVVALEHVDAATGAWRFAIASVVAGPPNATTTAPPHGRVAFVRPWEPVPRRDLSAAERAEATKLQAEATAMLRNCVAERRSLEAVRGDLKQQLSDVASELATVEEQISDILPILEEARAKVAGIKVAHLREVRAYKKPPAFIKAILEPVQILLREPSKAVGEWPKAVAMMATVDFVPRVRDLDPALLPPDAEKRFLKHMAAAFPPAAAALADGEGEDEAHAKDVAKAYHASAAAGPLLEWVFAVRAFLLKVPAEAKEALKRVASLRGAARELQDDVDRKAKDLQAANRQRAVLEMRLGQIKFGAASALIDAEASEAAEPMTLLRAPDEGTQASVLSSFWRPRRNHDCDETAAARPVAVPRTTLLCRLRVHTGEPPAEGTEAEQEAFGELDQTTFELRPEVLAGILSTVQGAGALPIETPLVEPVAPEAMISVDLPSPGAAGAALVPSSGRRKSGRSASGNRKASVSSTSAAARRSRSRDSSSGQQALPPRPPSAEEFAGPLPTTTTGSRGAHRLTPSAPDGTTGSGSRPATGEPRKQQGSELTQVPALAKTSDAAKESRNSSRASSRGAPSSRQPSRDASSRPVSVSPARSAVPTLPPLSPSTTPRLSAR